MDTSTYGGRTGRTNIEIPISRLLLLHEALDPVLAGRQLNKRKVPGQNTTFPNIQCCVLNHHYSRHGIQHIHYVWTSANETLRGAREGPSYTKTSVGYCDSGGPALRVLPFPPKASRDIVLGERMGRVRRGRRAQVEDYSESKVMNEKLGNYNSFSRKLDVYIIQFKLEFASRS
jgi:hypothetical protein